MEQNEQRKAYLQRISNILMINGWFLDDSGLFSGEMGIALFFLNYASFKKNAVYQDYAFEMIEKVQDKIRCTDESKHSFKGLSNTLCK
jgi:hypothetical protein